jgi:Zn-dependent protease with chaperone function
VRIAFLGRVVVFGSIVLTVGGCGVAENGQAAWVRLSGGELADARQLRADRLAQRILAQCAGQCITVRVVDTETIGAYAWPSGHIFLSRGLLDCMDDEEVSAALAHELGHLLSDGHLRSVAGLKGGEANGDLDCESRADQLGMQLLVVAHISPQAMTSMLRKVSTSPGISRACQERLVHRMEVLRLLPGRSSAD